MEWYGYTRCPECHVRLGYTDSYDGYNVWVRGNDGKMRRKNEARFFDPDWVIERHLRREH